MPTTTGDADARVTVPPGNAVKGVGDQSPTNGPNARIPRVPRTEDELWTDDPLLQSFKGADRKLHSVFGDTIHHNDGHHLTGGLGKTRTASGNVCTSALSRLVFLYIASDFSRCKSLSGAMSVC